jgi:hypothetical protein
MTDGHSALGQVQLEPPDVVGDSGLGRSLQERREPPAGTDVALCVGGLSWRALMSSIMR